MKKLSLLIPIIIVMFLCSPVNAKTLDVGIKYEEMIGQYVRVLRSNDSQISMQDALDAFKGGHFVLSPNPVINFGIYSKPIWLALQVSNANEIAVRRSLVIETPWLDKVDVYFLQHDQLINSYHTGDSLPFSERPLKHRFFIMSHGFAKGETTILVRIEAVDTIVLPILFMSTEEINDRDLLQGYSYGILCGVILALIAYNFILYIGLRSNLYLFYSVYLLLSLLVNAAFTGNGYQWLWPESPKWQLWANPVLVMAANVSGIAFTLSFLNIKQALPRTYFIITLSYFIFCALALLAILIDAFIMALSISLVFNFFFYTLTIALGAISLQSGNKYAKYFLLASIFTVVGGCITITAAWGIAPFNEFTSRAADIGLMIDAVLLARALAERLNIAQIEKLSAEKMAGIDPLTNLNNRRSFYKLVKPIWSLGLRSKSCASIIVLDIDHFKSLNDNHGHATGDQVLVKLAEAIQKEARGGDIVSRWGGEEFLIFLPNTRLVDAVIIADRMRRKISAMRIVSEKNDPFSLTASFGVAASLNLNNTSLEELISQADHQLYRAKERGRNCVCSALSHLTMHVNSLSNQRT